MSDWGNAIGEHIKTMWQVIGCLLILIFMLIVLVGILIWKVAS